MNGANLSVFQAVAPAMVGKTFQPGSGGQVEKLTCGDLYKATFRTASAHSAAGLCDVLTSLQPHEILTVSVPADGSVDGLVVAASKLTECPGAITRRKQDWVWPAGPGWLTLDFDAQKGEPVKSPDELWAAVVLVAPKVAEGVAVHWYSASSLIFDAEGREVIGIGGQRIYLLLADGGDVERAGRTLNQRLWLAGHGRVQISASGSLLIRSLFDAAMWQPGRLDFIAGARCHGGLEQRRGLPTILVEGHALDSREAIPDLSPDEARRYESLVQQAREAAEPEAAKVRASSDQGRKRSIIKKALDHGLDVDEAERHADSVVRAMRNGVLLGGFVLNVLMDDGAFVEVTVAQVLSQREKWHQRKCKVPLNEGHRDGAPDAIIDSMNPSPVIYSLDDGGAVFRLRRQKTSVMVQRGARGDAVEAIAQALAQDGDVFATAATSGASLLVEGRRVGDAMGMMNVIDSRVSLLSPPSGKDKRPAPVDVSREVAGLVLDRLRSGGVEVKRLEWTTKLPYVTASGRAVIARGWDPETRIFLDLSQDIEYRVPANPTQDELRDALVTLYRPFSLYGWEGPDDVGAVLAATLTAVERPTLDVAPGFGVAAYAQGTGKTDCALAVGALMTGYRPATTPPAPPGRDDSEWKKMVLTWAIYGVPFVCLDNVVGTFRSQALSGLMTNSVISDRVLGGNTQFEGPVRSMVTFTANSPSYDVDMVSRFVVARIASVREPHKRRFPFSPVGEMLRTRHKVAEAALTLLVGYFKAGAPTISTTAPRLYTQWGTLCREPLLWAAKMGYADALGLPWGGGPDCLGDPAASTLQDPASVDPELESLHDVLSGGWALSGGQMFTSATALMWFREGEHHPDEAAGTFRQGLLGLGARPTDEAQSLGKFLGYRTGRYSGGFVLRRWGGEKAKRKQWQIAYESEAPTDAANDPDGGLASAA